MPNWITNKVRAPSHVIAAMINAKGRIDFNTMMPFGGPVDFDSISMAAEEAAEVVLGVALDSHPLIAALQANNRSRCDIKKLRDDDFEDFVGMLRNHRACGYLHSMDFARKCWGTKWNACDQKHDIGAGTAEFETAWSCPTPVFEALAKRFPNDEIVVQYADEDIGSNAGEFTLKGAAVLSQNHAPAWRDMSEEQRAYWRKFACDVKGHDLRDYEEDETA